jgi:hypothetical protein
MGKCSRCVHELDCEDTSDKIEDCGDYEWKQLPVFRKWHITEKSMEFMLLAEKPDCSAHAYAWKETCRRRYFYLEDIPTNTPAILICQVQRKADLKTIRLNLINNGWSITKDNLPP